MKNSILLVDSNRMTTDFHRDALAAAGYTVEACLSGEKAVEAAEMQEFTLAIITLNLPGMDGLETFMLLRQRQKDIIGLLVTGSGSMETAIQALELGFSGLLKKPVTPDELLREVRRAQVRMAEVVENMRLRTLLPLYHLWERFIKAQTRDEVLTEFMGAIEDEMKAPLISVMMFDEQAVGLRIVASRNMDRGIVQDTVVAPGDKIAGWVYQQGEPVILNRGAAENSPFARFLQRDSIAAAISFPLKARARVLGVVNVSKTRAGEPFSQADIEMLSVISNQAVMALENVEMIQMRTEETRTRTLFEQYLAPEVAELLIAHGKNPMDVGEVKDLTVLFADLRNFTPLVQMMPLDTIRLFLNDFFSLFSEVIFSYKGTLDKFMGDAVLAIFGAPIPLVEQEFTAIEAAVQIRDRFRDMHQRWLQEQPCVERVGLGIGISAGEMFLGNVGSERRFDFTVIGTDVNLAQRLAAEARSGEILLSQTVFSRIGTRIAAELRAGRLLRGMDRAVDLYALIDGAAAATPIAAGPRQESRPKGRR